MLKLQTFYSIFIVASIVYCYVQAILIIKLHQQQRPIEIKKIKDSFIIQTFWKPRVLGYYVDDTTSQLSDKRKPMKLPVHWQSALYERYPSKRTVDWSVSSSLLENSAYYDKPTHNPLTPYKAFDECTAMHKWQSESFPTCNHVHEFVDLTALLSVNLQIELKRLLSSGYFRDTYVISDKGSHYNWSIDPIAFKTLRHRRRYDAWILERHRMDALVLDKMKQSDWILDIYAYCGSSGLYEFGIGDMSGSLIMTSKSKRDFSERYNYAIDVANAIADLHTIESYNQGMFSAVVHADIHTTQFVRVGKKFKLNDFNRCHFMFWNKTSNNSTCPYIYGDYNAGLFRAPEEYAYSFQTEAIDVYSMGNIFYSLLMDIEPFSKQGRENSDDIKRMIINGSKPELDSDILSVNDTHVMALIQAMQMCHEYDYKKRARAKEVRDFLVQKLNQIENKGDI